jgi:Carboxypeptidase regulatory-like domain
MSWHTRLVAGALFTLAVLEFGWVAANAAGLPGVAARHHVPSVARKDDAAPPALAAAGVAPGIAPTATPASVAGNGSIAGRVTDDHGTPLAGVVVNALHNGCCGYSYAGTLEDGTYVIEDLPPGSYTVSAGRTDCPSPRADRAAPTLRSTTAVRTAPVTLSRLTSTPVCRRRESILRSSSVGTSRARCGMNGPPSALRHDQYSGTTLWPEL